MSVIGNILWFIFAGFWQGVSWCLVGLVWCITIVGIPVGTQCFKMAGLAFFPFGKEVEYGERCLVKNKRGKRKRPKLRRM